MANARQVKQRIGTAKNISKITKAMEMVAASKMKRAQNQALSARAYSDALIESLRTLSKVVNPDSHPLFKKHTNGISIALLLSTDKGLCGSLNTNLMKQLQQWSKDQDRDVAVIAVGKKGVLAARALGLNLHAQFTNLPEKLSSSDVISITKLILDGFLAKEFASVDVIYVDFINTLSQKVKVEKLLPVVKLSNSIEDKTMIQKMVSDCVFEPSPKIIFDHIMPFYIENTVFHSLLELRASEHSARMVAMKNASENAAELVDELKLIYNKSRQQSITTELLDITTAMLALD